MPNRFNHRENGESSYFPKGRRERTYPEQNFQFRNQHGWGPHENESIRGKRDRPRTNSGYSNEAGEYAPAPRYAHRQDIHESYGGYSGEEYESGVYGYESSRDERFRGEYDRRRPYDPDYEFNQRRQRWRDDRDLDYASSQRHSQYEQGPYFGKGPKGYRRSDQRIEEDINERLTQHPFIDATDIEVRVQNGEVLLSGTVDDRNAKHIAEDIVDSVSGVKELQNQIRLNKNHK